MLLLRFVIILFSVISVYVSKPVTLVKVLYFMETISNNDVFVLQFFLYVKNI